MVSTLVCVISEYSVKYLIDYKGVEFDYIIHDTREGLFVEKRVPG